jgi:4-hydroxy-tetrahydrodipicolinate reductase
MKAGLIGYGQMGKAVEAAALQRGHSVVFRIDENNLADFTRDNLRKADVILEFTGPHSAFQNIIEIIKSGVPVVSGSTGWMDKLEEVKKCCADQNGAFFYASNFSLGVNILFALNRTLAKIMTNYPGYSPRIEEIHHIRKKDSPSGTALVLADGIISNHGGFDGWTDNLVPDPGKVPVTSIREGEVTGTHEIRYVSKDDVLSLRHEAFSRNGLAVGAVMAAEFLIGKKGVFGMNDLLGIG